MNHAVLQAGAVSLLLEKRVEREALQLPARAKDGLAGSAAAGHKAHLPAADTNGPSTVGSGSQLKLSLLRTGQNGKLPLWELSGHLLAERSQKLWSHRAGRKSVADARSGADVHCSWQLTVSSVCLRRGDGVDRLAELGHPTY
jgi:hypothetical protein